ncbi:hypothetical protein KSP40_PGU006630 [Platanthera guangdongensis]|uniref:Calmodulin binding protein-like N-terminal domain-containing protein n=1 Tax=Platanthera guangdongensis TaxID=2320717 RepID=A0ABR2MKI5_9ASPA
MTGDLQVTLKEGVGTLGELTFTDNSSWIRSRKFRLGLKISSGYCDGIRVREGKTEAFTVMDHRGECRSLYWILESGMSNKMWDILIEHVKTCRSTHRWAKPWSGGSRSRPPCDGASSLGRRRRSGELKLSSSKTNSPRRKRWLKLIMYNNDQQLCGLVHLGTALLNRSSPQLCRLVLLFSFGRYLFSGGATKYLKEPEQSITMQTVVIRLWCGTCSQVAWLVGDRRVAVVGCSPDCNTRRQNHQANSVGQRSITTICQSAKLPIYQTTRLLPNRLQPLFAKPNRLTIETSRPLRLDNRPPGLLNAREVQPLD